MNIIINLLLYFLLIINIFAFNLVSLKEENKVILHLERFNKKLNLLHVGISFNNDKEIIRFDFRPYNYGKSYLTTEYERLNFNLFLRPSNLNYDLNQDLINIINEYQNILIFDSNNIDKKNIFWGITNKSQYEILEYEKNFLINKKYKVGIYDCRHYVNDFTLWCLEKPTPIWKLKNLWDCIK